MFDPAQEYRAGRWRFLMETKLLVGRDLANIVATEREMLAGKGKAGKIPPLWDGQAAGRIFEILLRQVPREKAP